MNNCRDCQFLKKFEWCKEECDIKEVLRQEERRRVLAEEKRKKAMLTAIDVILDEYALKPVRAHEDDAGLDIRSPNSVTVCANSSLFVPTGVHVKIPKGYVGLLTSKSGLMMKGITSRGTIDSGYTGSIGVVLFNASGLDYKVKRGDKISQLVLLPIITPAIRVVEEFEETERGDGGFGSTGK